MKRGALCASANEFDRGTIGRAERVTLIHGTDRTEIPYIGHMIIHVTFVHAQSDGCTRTDGQMHRYTCVIESLFLPTTIIPVD